MASSNNSGAGAAASIMPLSASATHIALPFTAIDLRHDTVRALARPPLTPSTLAITTLIRYYTEAKPVAGAGASAESDENTAPNSVRSEHPRVLHVLSLFILRLLRNGDECRDMTLRELTLAIRQHFVTAALHTPPLRTRSAPAPLAAAAAAAAATAAVATPVRSSTTSQIPGTGAAAAAADEAVEPVPAFMPSFSPEPQSQPQPTPSRAVAAAAAPVVVPSTPQVSASNVQTPARASAATTAAGPNAGAFAPRTISFSPLVSVAASPAAIPQAVATAMAAVAASPQKQVPPTPLAAGKQSVAAPAAAVAAVEHPLLNAPARIIAYLTQTISGFQSPDRLFDFFTDVGRLVVGKAHTRIGDAATKQIDALSIFGLSVRSTVVAWHELMFDAVCRLSQQIESYYDHFLASETGTAPVASAALASTTAAMDFDLDAELDRFRPNTSIIASPLPAAAHESKTNAIAQPAASENAKPVSSTGSNVPVAKLQLFAYKTAAALPGSLGRVPADSVDQLLSRVHPNPQIPELSFLRYLSCVQTRDFEGAIDHLHHYFDHVTLAARRLDGFTDVKSNSGTPTLVHTPNRQYAALNLALLHFAFGHFEYAQLAIGDSIRFAQSVADHTCLMHALAIRARIAAAAAVAHCHTAAHSPNAGLTTNAAQWQYCARESAQQLQRAVIEHARAANKARKLRDMWLSREIVGKDTRELGVPPPPVPTVDATNWLGFAKFQLQFIRTVIPLTASAAPAATATNANATNPTSVWAALQKAIHLSVGYGLESVQSSSHVLRANAWKLFGSSHLSNLYAEMQLKYYSDSASAIDTCAALSSIAGASGESLETASESVSKFGSLRYPFAADNGLREAAACINFERAFARNDVTAARACAAEVFALTPHQTIDSDLSLTSLVMSAQLRIMNEDFTAAIADATTVISLAATRCGVANGGGGGGGGGGQPAATAAAVQTVRCCLLIAGVYMNRTVRQPLSAVPYVCRALALCESLSFDTLKAEVRLRLAELQLQIGVGVVPSPQLKSEASTDAPVSSPSPHDAALSSLAPYIPHIFEHANTTIQVDAYLLLAECIIAVAPSDQHGTISRAIEYLHSALRCEYFPTARICVLELELTGCCGVCVACRIVCEHFGYAKIRAVVYLLSRAYDAAGDVSERNRFAKRFVSLNSEAAPPAI